MQDLGLYGPVLMFLAVLVFQYAISYGRKKCYESKREGKTKQSDTKR